MARRTFSEFRTALRRQTGDPGDRNVLSTLGVAVTAGDTSVTLASTKGFPGSGYAVIEGDVFSWSAKTSTVLSGVPATGKGAFASNHAVTGVEVMGCIVTEDDLEEWLSEAIDEYNRYRPYRTTGTLTTVAGQKRYDYPTDALRISRLVLIDTDGQADTPYAFTVEELDTGNKIVLPSYWSGDSEALTVYCEKNHTTFRGAAEDGESTVPEQDEWLILLYAKACIHRQRAQDTAALTKRRRLQRSDDPGASQKAQEATWQKLEEQFRESLKKPYHALVRRQVVRPGESGGTTYRAPFGLIEADP